MKVLIIKIIMNENEKFCLADQCRYNKTHVTWSHRCGRCHRFGHGQMECGDINKITELHNLANNTTIEFPEELYCTIQNCTCPHTHNNESHHCGFCGGREHNGTGCNHRGSFRSTSRAILNNEIPFGEDVDLPEEDSAPSSPLLVPPVENSFTLKCPICRTCHNLHSFDNIFLPQTTECTVCKSNSIEIILPCNHACLCKECAVRMKE